MVMVPVWSVALAGAVMLALLIAAIRGHNRAVAEMDMAHRWRCIMDDMERSNEERFRKVEEFMREVDTLQEEHIKRMEAVRSSIRRGARRAPKVFRP